MMTEQELHEQFMNALSDEHRAFSFTEEFVADMARNAVNYDRPEEFFEELAGYGCVDCTDMLMYHDDCAHIYCDNMDDIEAYIDELETIIPKKLNVPRYTFICWWCYESIGDEIYCNLFDQFMNLKWLKRLPQFFYKLRAERPAPGIEILDRDVLERVQNAPKPSQEDIETMRVIFDELSGSLPNTSHIFEFYPEHCLISVTRISSGRCVLFDRQTARDWTVNDMFQYILAEL